MGIPKYRIIAHAPILKDKYLFCRERLHWLEFRALQWNEKLVFHRSSDSSLAHIGLELMGCINLDKITRRSLHWYTAHFFCPMCAKVGQYSIYIISVYCTVYGYLEYFSENFYLGAEVSIRHVLLRDSINVWYHI